MVRMVQSIKNPGSDELMEKKFEEILKGGKEASKRHYAVNESLYGTEEGVKQRHLAEEERKQRQKKKNRRAAPKGEKKSEERKEIKNGETIEGQSRDELINQDMSGTRTKSIVAVAVLGTVAAGASIFFGGRRSQ